MLGLAVGAVMVAACGLDCESSLGPALIELSRSSGIVTCASRWKRFSPPAE